MASQLPSTVPQAASVIAQSDYGSDLEHDLLLASNPSVHPPDSRSDYGSEFDTDTEQIIAKLISGLAGETGKSLVLESIVEDDNKRCVAHLPKGSSQNSTAYSDSPEEGVVVEGEISVGQRTSHSTRMLPLHTWV
jgi:hypothetical protein